MILFWSQYNLTALKKNWFYSRLFYDTELIIGALIIN